MGRPLTSLLLALGICLLGAVSATAQVEVSAVSEPQTAAPGDFVTTVFEVVNRGNATATFDLELDLPPGWTPLAPPRSVTLDAGESERLFISINVARQAEAGDGEVTLSAIARADASVRDSAAAVITVETRPSLALRPPGEQQVLPGETVTLAFEVVNRGNVIDRAMLEAQSFRNFPVEISPSSAELMPGETLDVDVGVTVPEGAEPGRDRVTLTARSAQFELQTSATVELTVLPPAPREVSQDLSLSVPSVLRIRETTTTDDPIEVRTSVSGDAPFGDGSTIDYEVAIANLLDLRTVRAQLVRPTYGVTLGDVTTPLTRLINVDGRGARLSLRAGPDNESGATVASARDLETDRINIGARAALQASGWFTALAGRRRPQADETTVGVSLSQLPLTSPDLVVEGAFSRDPVRTDSAFLVQGSATLTPFTVDGEFVRAGPRFPGSISDQLSVALEPGVAFDDAEINLDLAWERDGLGPAPVQTGTAETQIGATARLAIDPLPTVVAQADYETERTIGTPKLVDQTLSTVRARASETFGPLTLGARVLREVSENRLAGTTIARSQWRIEAELRLASALLAARLGMTSDVDVNTNAIDDRFLTARLLASWQFEAFDIGFRIERNRNATRLAAEVDGDVDRWTLSTNGSVRIDDNEAARFTLNVAAALDFDLPVPFIEVNGQVEGHVFVDANGNGVRDEGEDGVSGLRLSLDNAQARTNEDGFYRFPPTAPGDNELEIESLPSTLKSATTLPRQVTIEAGQRQRVDLPLIRVASLQAIVFNDADEDGTRDNDEAGVSGVRIEALGPDGRDRSTRTGANGTAEIGRLTPGRWRVSLDEATLPENVELTTDGQVSVDIGPGERAEVAFGTIERTPEVRFSPTAEFSVTPTEPVVGETVTLDGSDSFDPDGSIESYEWDVDGDGSVDATGQRIQRVYDTAREVEVTLTVTDDDGLTGSQTKTVRVVAP